MWEVLNKLGSIARLGGVAAGEPVAIVGQKDPFCVVVMRSCNCAISLANVG